MKHLFTTWIVLSILLVSNNSFAQSKAKYISFNLGYAFPATGYLMGNTQNQNSTKTNYESNRKGPNTGLNFGINAGYQFSGNLAFDMGINYLTGSWVRISELNYSSSSQGITSTNDFKSRGLRIAPAMKFSAVIAKLIPYGRVGFSMYLFNKQTENSVISQTSSGVTSKTEITTEITGAFSMGYTGALGVEYKIKKASFFAEVNFYSQTFVYKSSEVTKYWVNGIDKIYSLKMYDRKAEFSSSFTEPKNINPDQPSKQAVISMPFSNYSISVGTTIYFN